MVQEYLVKLLGRYREFVDRDMPSSPASGADMKGAGPRPRFQDDGYVRHVLTSTLPLSCLSTFCAASILPWC